MAKDIILAAGFVASGVGATGLTVTVDVWRVAVADLSKSEIVTAGSATEIGDGVYAYRVANADLQTYYYYAAFKTSGTADVKHLFGVQLDFADSSSIASLVWASATRTLTSFSTLVADIWAYASRTLTQSGLVTYTGPVAASGAIEIVRGDDYSNNDSRALEWETDDSATWPTLTGATITFTMRQERGGKSVLTKAGSVVTDTGANKKVRVELTSAETAALVVGTKNYKFDVQATLASSSNKVTLVRDYATVLEDVH